VDRRIGCRFKALSSSVRTAASFASSLAFWQEGVSRLGAARAGLYLYLEPLATLGLAVPLLDEPFGPVAALGGALVLAGVAIGQRDGRG
jgi:drug/metabolite transporter (DMT)-like permease